MKYKSIFSRFEIKYIITVDEYVMLKNFLTNKIKPDEYGKTLVRNLYFDTQDYLLIRRSIDKPEYKEKLRLRTYGDVGSNSGYYLELKKKYDSVVYKRRFEVEKSLSDINSYKFPQTQTGREIEFAVNRYKYLQPKVYLSYEREAYIFNENSDYRLTFDKNITWRNYNLSLLQEEGGNKLLPDNKVLMELKISAAIPLWLVKYFSEHKIYKTSFSKYGEAYAVLERKQYKNNTLSALEMCKGDLVYV